MTGHQIDNFVGSLVEMAKAFEERPALHDRIHSLEGEVSRVNNDNQALRDSNDILRQHIDELNSKVAEVTKERDDAGFRCLEADDKAARILDLARTLASGLGQVIAEVEPPKPQEPVLVPEGMAWGSGERAADPTTENTASGASQESSDSKFPAPTASPTENATSNEVSTTGQSEPLPTAAVNIGETLPSAGQSPVPNSDATSTETVVSADKPYAGKRLSEFVYSSNYPTREAWYAGGGDYEGWWS